MRRTLLPFLTLTVLLLPSSLLQAKEKDFPGIENLMSDAEYRAAGLDKLSPSERQALNQWLISYTVKDAQHLRSSSAELRQAEDKIRIEAQVKGAFKGWRGKTVFTLDNGQVWQQRLSGRFFYSGENRRVLIKKNLFGFYELTHVATGKTVGVSRKK
ncbi:hypothetical protein H2508_10505 [Parahaliea sp. F7430]|uniref:Uncharacterized protein n=1 Tax=Sediminihaliea albiluteola TaxID=2758564 RepID=A0A7W2YKC0_9GAMM|nr:hypothetical protein [Sediminihaliea albiluteola]MBA6413539.1 hypothetical protein [Sediminihaliea albiluteola]